LVASSLITLVLSCIISFWFGMKIISRSSFYSEINFGSMNNLPTFTSFDYFLAVAAAIIGAVTANSGAVVSAILMANAFDRGPSLTELVQSANQSWISRILATVAIFVGLTAELFAAVFFYVFIGHPFAIGLVTIAISMLAFIIFLDSAWPEKRAEKAA
jgi:hypothetical protein